MKQRKNLYQSYQFCYLLNKNLKKKVKIYSNSRNSLIKQTKINKL